MESNKIQTENWEQRVHSNNHGVSKIGEQKIVKVDEKENSKISKGNTETEEEIDKEDEGEKERPVNDKEKQQYEALGWSAVSPHWSELV